MSQFHIRKAKCDDTLEVRKLHAASWLATYPSVEYGVSYEWVKEYTDKWLTPERLEKSKEIIRDVIESPVDFYRLAEKDRKVVGFIHIRANEDGTKELEAIYTSPETFGSGLGQKLMSLADEWIEGVTVTLSVAIYNERAIRFYKKNGFEIIPNSQSMYKEKIPIIRMIRKGEKT